MKNFKKFFKRKNCKQKQVSAIALTWEKTK